MAFANLFTGLSMDQDVTHSGAGERKRRSQAELRGPDNKKQGYEAQSSWTYKPKPFKDDDSTEHSRTGFSKDLMHNHSDNSGHNNMHHKGQNAKKNYKQQQQNNQGDGRRNQHHQKDRGGFSNGGGHYQTRFTSRKFGGQGKRKYANQDFKVPPTRLMTQEFREQNALLVDGQLLCRHFIWGRCIKGDECQLKHIQGSNDIIKEVCKYYVQGFCTKGESCPYMHKSFPCKFFHRKGKCSHGVDCNFSHDPLNETTSRLFEEVLKRDKDLYELSKIDEQKSSGQPANTDETEITESKKTPDVLTQPLRPIFYNSEEPKTEQEVLLCKTEEQREIQETAVPPEASDSGRPHSPLSTQLNHQEPVCYSVEAVLRPQLFKPFPSFFTTPGSQDYASLSGPQNSSDCTSGSADQSKAPYSVDVVRSCKSEVSFIVGHTSSPPTAQYVSYTPKTDREQRTDPLLSSNTDKVSYSTNTRNEANISQEKKFKCLPSFHTFSDLISKTCPDLTVASGDDKKHVGEVAASLKPAQRASREVKSELFYSPATVTEKSALSHRKVDIQRSPHLLVDTLHSVNCKSEGVFPFATTKLKSQTFNPPQMRPYLSGLTSKSQALAKPLRPSSGFSVFKGGAAVPAEPVTSSAETNNAGNSDVHHLRAKQPSETHEPSKQLQLILEPGTRQPNSSEATAECSSNMEHCGDSSFGRNKTFCSLFASPITDSQKLTPDFVTTSTSRQSSCSTPLSAHSKSEDYHVKTVAEPDKASARSFLGLFSAPLSAAPLPCKETQPDYSRTASCTQESNQLSDNVTHSSDSNQRASNAETPLPRLVKTSHRPTSPKFSSRLKNENEDDLSEAVSQATKQQVNPACLEISSSRTPCGDRAGSSTTKVGATSNSVLKTLFLCLSPFEEGGEQRHSAHISLPSESVKKEQSSTGDVFVEPQRKRKKKRRKKKQQSTEKSVAHSTEHQTSLISVEATVGSTFSAPTRTEPQVRNSGTHNLPFRPVTQLTQHHVRPRLNNSSEEGKWGNGNVSVTPLKDLFKTLDTTVFNVGH
ncbi:uncharacterized protein LOC118116255 isoform X2 [Hippoglossus stenolepis]|uniref:uncharacterized protein LOC118116255 isoform X2 n=1 Tax=Hippoglossus stenolepis TaxID=195615 RepID=UPI001FB011A6|nr:uncharacterized protein LOC118116255 isoform X2 [Hippoglossus stenolepis]